MEITLQHFGRIDALVNNAGYAAPGAIEDVPDECWSRLFAVNVFGAARTHSVCPTQRAGAE